jgi:hypothetical protein
MFWLQLAAALGRGAAAGTTGAAPSGKIVILAVPYASAVPVVSQYGDPPTGKMSRPSFADTIQPQQLRSPAPEPSGPR